MKIIKITIFLALLLFFYITTVSFIFAAQCKPHQKPVFDSYGFFSGCDDVCPPGQTYISGNNSCWNNPAPSGTVQRPPTSELTSDLGAIQGVGGFLPELNISAIGEMFETFFSNLLGVFTIVAGLMFLIYFVFGALSWITAEGDPEKVKKAQKQITNAVLGLVLVVIAYSIITIIGQVLGLNILNPAGEIENLGPNQ